MIKCVEVEFRHGDLDQLELDIDCTGGRPQEVVRAYRKVLRLIRAAFDERDIRNMRSLRFKKLKGSRSHQYSMRLNDQWRLIVEIRKAEPKNIVVVIEIEDYH